MKAQVKEWRTPFRHKTLEERAAEFDGKFVGFNDSWL